MANFGDPQGYIKLWRCQTCGKLLTERRIRDGRCAGHKIKAAISGSLFEWIGLKLGLIR